MLPANGSIPLQTGQPGRRQDAPGNREKILFTGQFIPNSNKVGMSSTALITVDLVREVIFAIAFALDVQRGAVQRAAERDHFFVRDRDDVKTKLVKLLAISSLM